MTLLSLLYSCQSQPTTEVPGDMADTVARPLAVLEELSGPESVPFSYDTTQWADIMDLDPSINLDLRYASTDNFVEEKMYECGRCFLRKAVAKSLVKAHQALQAQGYGGLKMYDCYRPRPIQWALWKKVPNPNYVADPRKGSMHNRGSAVDLTIVDASGVELDMGTGFDFFGKEAHHDYLGHPEVVQKNRDVLKSIMDQNGFRSIRTEWWHYSYRPQRYEISDMIWECP